MEPTQLHLHYVTKHNTGAYGVLLDDDKLPFAVSLQPDDLCFSDGEYVCTKTHYHRGNYPTFEIHYAGHSRVLFHKGNHEKDSRLCVLVAEAFEIVDGMPGIAQSRAGFEQFMAKYGHLDEFILVVTSKK
jgi:hypothetical protein